MPVRWIDISKLYRPVWVVKHDRIDIYLRDPYRMRAGAGDPRYDWGKLDQAFPFSTFGQAEYVCESAGWYGRIVEVDRNLVRRSKDPRLRQRGSK